MEGKQSSHEALPLANDEVRSKTIVKSRPPASRLTMKMWVVFLLGILPHRVAASAATIDCRSDPTWIGKEDSCASQTGWDPRSRIWNGKLNRFEHQVLYECVADEHRQFLAQAQIPHRTMSAQREEGSSAQLRRASSLPRSAIIRQPKITNVYPGPDTPLAVEISFALSEHEAAAVRATASCIREYHPETHFEVRQFDYGGNNCTFMAAYIQTLVPGVAAQVVELARMAWDEANWKEADYDDPATMGLRTIEHLQYTGGGELSPHLDSQSAFTVLVALSHPDDYDGGEYVLYSDDASRELQRVKLDQYSAMVFLSSEAMHGVSPIRGGVREMLAVELWNEDDVPYNERRPEIQSFHEHWSTEAVDADLEDL